MIDKLKAQPNCWPVGMAGLAIFFTLISCDLVYAQTCTISGSGSTNWANGNPPACQEGGNAGNASVIIIPSGRTIVFDGDQDTWTGTRIDILGTLSVSAPGQSYINSNMVVKSGGLLNIGTQLYLGSNIPSCSYNIVVETGGAINIVSGAGASDRLTICGSRIAQGGGGCNDDFPEGDIPFCREPGGFQGPFVFDRTGLSNDLLPVDLLSFTASQTENSILLTWQTATELNNDYFTIERSQNGIHYEAIGKVQGYGTTNEQQDYEFADNNPLQGLSYYRLRQTDFDGTIEIFRPVSVVFEGLASASALIFPNPLHKGLLHISFQNLKNNLPTNIHIIDASGITVFATTAHIGNSSHFSKALNLDFLPKGYYLIHITNSEIDRKFKLVK